MQQARRDRTTRALAGVATQVQKMADVLSDVAQASRRPLRRGSEPHDAASGRDRGIGQRRAAEKVSRLDNDAHRNGGGVVSTIEQRVAEALTRMSRFVAGARCLQRDTSITFGFVAALIHSNRSAHEWPAPARRANE
jgi:hypothetical protein